MGNYFVKGNEIWIELDQETLNQLVGDPRVKFVLNGKLYVVIRLSGLPTPTGLVPNLTKVVGGGNA